MAMPRRKEIDGKVQCITCKEWKTYEEFHSRNESGRPYSKCKVCHNFYAGLRQKANPPDPEKRRTWARKHYQHKWYQKDTYSAHNSAKGYGVVSDLTSEQWLKKVEEHGYKCYLCGKKLSINCSQENTITLEHIVPLSRGGKNTKDNVAPACAVCNYAKRALTLEEFIAMAKKWATL